MMFTDEDLKQLKDGIDDWESLMQSGTTSSFNGRTGKLKTYPTMNYLLPLITALLVRLEAAERIVFLQHKYTDAEEVYVPCKEAYEAWRKAAGKDGGAI